MHKLLCRSLWLVLLGLVPLLAACDEVTETPTPAADQGQVALSVPTRTLGPIVSFTPRFTATPIPSLTLTPSNTPTVTLTVIPPTRTATPSPTPTATVEGIIQSGENVNLREGPGTDYPIVVSVPPGTTLGVMGLQTDSRGQEWYKVAYAEPDGEVLYLWIVSRLVTTNFKDIVQEPAAVTIAPGITPTLGTPVTPRPTLSEPNRVEILAYCRQKNLLPPEVTAIDNVYAEWSWFVARPELMDQHLTNARYEVRLDGEILENWNRYGTEIKEEGGVWIVYWYYPLGRLAAGDHKLEFRLTWNEAITDGYKQFGPGTANEIDTGDCSFSVGE
ncbi:MAG: SH3 domain-containing protein [Chloroflexi bacterium]|nr:SH3 domain-containing protein [Chloroflexota bacterium]